MKKKKIIVYLLLILVASSYLFYETYRSTNINTAWIIGEWTIAQSNDEFLWGVAPEDKLIFFRHGEFIRKNFKELALKYEVKEGTVFLSSGLAEEKRSISIAEVINDMEDTQRLVCHRNGRCVLKTPKRLHGKFKIFNDQVQLTYKTYHGEVETKALDIYEKKYMSGKFLFDIKTRRSYAKVDP